VSGVSVAIGGTDLTASVFGEMYGTGVTVIVDMSDTSRPLSFQAALEDLLSLMSQPTTPPRCIDGAFEVFDLLGKCLFVKVKKHPAPLTDDGVGILQPSDLFLRYVAAFRAGDWPLVGVIEHDIRS
jgi:hypothetical protein